MSVVAAAVAAAVESSVRTHNLGFPRIGPHRELKKSLELYWGGKCKEQDLINTASEMRKQNWLTQKNAGIDIIPINDFSLYDHVLDTAVMLGAIPQRYQVIKDDLAQYFAMARGRQDKAKASSTASTTSSALSPSKQTSSSTASSTATATATTTCVDVSAMEMTKWFDTNYHFIVPELETKQTFKLNPTKILNEIKEAFALGITTPRPVILGPVSFLLLSKVDNPHASPLDLLGTVLPVYQELFELLKKQGIEWVQIDEPHLVLDLDQRISTAYADTFSTMSSWKSRPKVFLATYFGATRENFDLVVGSGFEAFHVDLTRDDLSLDQITSKLSSHTNAKSNANTNGNGNGNKNANNNNNNGSNKTILSLGIVDGRNIWRTDLDKAHRLIRQAVKALGPDRVLVGPSCSLLHVPVSLEQETGLDPELKSWLSFATEKLGEIRALADNAARDKPQGEYFDTARAAIASRVTSSRTTNKEVRARLAKITPAMFSRGSNYSTRAKEQEKNLKLPLYPTTTIGSFPQTESVRKARASHRAGRLSEEEYNEFLRRETKSCIEKQEQIGLDVLVHGEFERTDMVEYFGEKLQGLALTLNGWVQSYGSRCVKPPIIFGDVIRPEAMTVNWSVYSQSLTSKPVKGMLTGPVTILEWAFVRDDQPRSQTCMQLALALRDEVCDLERAGITVIQVDEPAVREGLPLRKSEWKPYLRYSVDGFRLATSGVLPTTQIHTHMCYCDFGDILDSVVEMDADVISIETSRSRMELLEDFKTFHYPNEVGPGVYDIHSPRVPTTSEIVDLLQRARKVLPVRSIWVNPDCGLKTRQWPEVQSALENMVEAARILRKQEITQSQHQ